MGILWEKHVADNVQTASAEIFGETFVVTSYADHTGQWAVSISYPVVHCHEEKCPNRAASEALLNQITDTKSISEALFLMKHVL